MAKVVRHDIYPERDSDDGADDVHQCAQNICGPRIRKLMERYEDLVPMFRADGGAGDEAAGEADAARARSTSTSPKRRLSSTRTASRSIS